MAKVYVVGWAPSFTKMDSWRPLGQKCNEIAKWDLDKTTFYTDYHAAEDEVINRQFRQKGVCHFCIVEVEY